MTKARHLAGELQRDNIEKNLCGEKALNFGLENNRNCGHGPAKSMWAGHLQRLSTEVIYSGYLQKLSTEVIYRSYLQKLLVQKLLVQKLLVQKLLVQKLLVQKLLWNNYLVVLLVY